MALYEFEGKRPQVGDGTFVHPEATLIGGVTIGTGCFIGPGARLRGDWGNIFVGDGSNIQDNCIIHVRPDADTVLGPCSHIGHGAILHGCTLGEHVLAGMGAIILDYVELGDNVIVAPGCVVTEGTQVPAGMLIRGVPGRIAGPVKPQVAQMWSFGTQLYQELAARCLEACRRIDPP